MWRSNLQNGELIISIVFSLFIHSCSLISAREFAPCLCCRSFSVLVKDLDGKNHEMTVLNLLYPINEQDSYKKVNKSSAAYSASSPQPSGHEMFVFQKSVAGFGSKVFVSKVFVILDEWVCFRKQCCNLSQQTIPIFHKTV